MSRSTAVAVFVLVSACSPGALAANPYDDLLKHASSNTNALVLLDLKQAYASPLAKKEKWADRVRQNGHGGLGFFPAESELLAIAAEVNLTTMVREHQIGFVKVNNLPNFNSLAAREGGNTDEIADQLTVFSPRNVYFTSFPGGTFAAVSPADRQFLSRWLRANKAGKLSPLAPYLQAAADSARGNTVTIALDLQDSVDPGLLQFGLGASPVMVKHKGFNLKGLSVFLARAKGLTFAARVTDAVSASITVEFADDTQNYKGFLKDLFLEVIDSYGVSIPGLEQWEAKITEKTLTLSGPMAPEDLRRAVSLFAFPQPDLEPPSATGDQDGPNAAATKRYVVAVDEILKDIKSKMDSTNYYKTATWHDKAAQQLEHLSYRSVDPIAVDAARQAARNLRLISDSLRGVPVDINAATSKAYIYGQSNPYWGWGPHWGGWWGGYRRYNSVSVQTNLPQVQAEISKTVADDQKKRTATWTQIDQLMSDARRKLTDKYKTGF